MGYGLVSDDEREGGLPHPWKDDFIRSYSDDWKLLCNWGKSPWTPVKTKQNKNSPCTELISEILSSKNEFLSLIPLSCYMLEVGEEGTFIPTSHLPSRWMNGPGMLVKKDFMGECREDPSAVNSLSNRKRTLVTSWIQILTIQNCAEVGSSTRTFIQN